MARHYIFGGGHRIGVLGLLLKLCGGHQVDGASKVGNELAERYSRARMLKQARCSQRSGADAAAFIGVDCRDGAIKIGEFCRPGLAIDLMLCQRQQAPHADPRIILDGQLLRLRPG